LRPASKSGAAAVWGMRSVESLDGSAHLLQPESTADTMLALAVAVSTFSRPIARSDGATEKPSLYAPFWYSRMASSTVAERALMASLDGDPLWLASVPR